MSTDLDVEIRANLESRRGDWPKIAQTAQVSHSWISQFVRGKIPNPGYETLKRLNSALSDKPAARSAQNHPGQRATDRPQVKAA